MQTTAKLTLKSVFAILKLKSLFTVSGQKVTISNVANYKTYSLNCAALYVALSTLRKTTVILLFLQLIYDQALGLGFISDPYSQYFHKLVKHIPLFSQKQHFPTLNDDSTAHCPA